MCFSAAASFTSGVVLSTVGAVAIKKAKAPADIPFASIPLIFAVQQLVEGFLWLALTNPDYTYMEHFSTYSFLVFAQVIWPFWIPFSVFKFSKFENHALSKFISIVLVGVGAFLSVASLVYLINYPISGEIIGSHISYKQDYPQTARLIGAILYAIVTVVPLFINSNRRMLVLAVAILLSYAVTLIFYDQYVVSVWCFFAAVLSAIILWIVYGKTHDKSVQ